MYRIQLMCDVQHIPAFADVPGCMNEYAAPMAERPFNNKAAWDGVVTVRKLAKLAGWKLDKEGEKVTCPVCFEAGAEATKGEEVL